MRPTAVGQVLPAAGFEGRGVAHIRCTPYCYVITACPDGEGAWYQETVRRDSARAQAYKKAYQRGFTPEFVQLVANSVRNCAEPLTLVDIGGVPDEKNEKISAGRPTPYSWLATAVRLTSGVSSRLEWV